MFDGLELEALDQLAVATVLWWSCVMVMCLMKHWLHVDVGLL